MFRLTDPQVSLLESEFLLPPKKVERLKKSWAEPFRARVLPKINEEHFRDAFNSSNGRPNKSIRLLVCLHLLKEWNDLTDEQVIDQLEYNLQWHYALAVTPGTAHISQKTMHNFRVLLMKSDRARRVFEDMTRALAEDDSIKLGRQRLDSTHVLSNIAVLTRFGLFVETVTHFLKELRREQPAAVDGLKQEYRRRYLEREGYFSDAKREQARRRLPVVAKDVYALLCAFRDDEVVRALPTYQLLQRLFDEQCELVDDDDEPQDGRASTDASDDGDGGGPPDTDVARVQLREPRDIKADTLQSPHDPDATYGHKGKGYEAQIVETCDEENPYQLATHVSVNGAHESDQRAVVPVLDQLEASGMRPDELLADTGYGSGANIVAAAERDVDLQAPVQDPNAPARAERFTHAVAETTEQTASSDSSTAPVVDADDTVDLGSFAFDTTCSEVICCPAGQPPSEQQVAGGRLTARFPASCCATCPLAAECPTRPIAAGDRLLCRAPATIATALRQAEQQQKPFKDRYRMRSGIESTNQELKGRHGLRDLRVRRRPRVELAVTLKTLAMNVKRAVLHHTAQLAAPVPCAAPA